MTRSYRQQSTEYSTPAFSRGLLIGLPFLFLLAAVLFNIVAFASVGTVGGELYAITSKTEQLAAQNQRLSEELAQKESLHGSLSQAHTLGFVPISKLTQVDSKDTKVALIHE